MPVYQSSLNYTNPGPTSASPYALALWSFQNAWDVAKLKSQASDDTFAAAQTAAGSPTIYSAPFSFTPNVVEPNVTIPSNASGTSTADFQILALNIINQLIPLFTSYLSTYFPNVSPLQSASTSWVTNAITYGGTGISPNIENQIWQRDRSRILDEGDRATDEALTFWATKGYDFPSGGLLAQVSNINKDVADKLAQASRDVAIKAAELEQQNVQFAVTKAIDSYNGAMAAASDYIKSLALGFQVGGTFQASQDDAQARLISAASTYYQNRIEVEKLKMQALQIPGSWDQEARIKNGELLMTDAKLRVDAAIAAAQSLGTQAASALNSLHVAASVSGSANNGVNYSYNNSTETEVPSVVIIQ